MGIRSIVKLGDEALRKICKEQTTFGPRLWMLLGDMADTMYKADGVGLAAPQVGILRRVVVIDVDDDNGLIELINPVITEVSEEIQCGREGCLSLPGRQGVVTRPKHVKVEALDRHGKPFTIEGEGLLARALCHEIDHLDGRLWIDVMDRELTAEEIEGEIPEDAEE